VDAFGAPEDIRYCAVWSLNGGLHAWNAEAVDDKGKSLKQRSDALLSVGARPTLVALTPAGGLAALYVDNVLTQPWSMNAPLSAAELKVQMAAEAKAGRFPVRIGTATVGGAVQFAAIFAGTDDIVPRKLRPSGPVPEGLSAIDQARVKSIDKWMGKYLTSNNLRGAALAIVDGTRLVYAQGYTYAEPAAMYPDIEPTTLFRLGSVSKTFCAVAVWRALADDPARSRSSKMQKVLELEPEEDESIPAGFADVTLRHLLESNSGIGQFGMRRALNDVQRDGGEQPLTAARIASAVAGYPMSGVPGAMKDGKQDTQYGKVDYFLLGLVAAELAGTADFDSALKKLVLDPLHMTRTRGARAKIEDRADDEARHHMPGLETGPSEMHQDVPRPIMPLQYAGSNCEVYDGAGGVSAAVVDVARLGAMLACRVGNPIFSAATLDAMLSDAVAATTAGSDQGYHGFDWAIAAGATNPVVIYEKGGDIAGAGAAIRGTTGKRVVVIFRNGEYLLWGNTDWRNAIPPLADAINWGKGDLFPDYGMPSL
jgi:CubicO group peptidase (beta-lactamase class C family)